MTSRALAAQAWVGAISTLGGGDLDAEPAPLAQVLAGTLLQRGGGRSGEGLGDGGAVGQGPATVRREYRVAAGGVLGHGLQCPGALLAARGVAEELVDVLADAALGTDVASL